MRETNEGKCGATGVRIIGWRQWVGDRGGDAASGRGALSWRKRGQGRHLVGLS